MADEMRFKWETVSEAKDVLRQLKLKKKELTAAKGEYNKAIAAVRAEHRGRTADRGSKMRGGGGFGKFVRGVQTAQRDADRKNTEHKVQELEKKRNALDADIASVDAAILQVEKWIAEAPPEEKPARRSTATTKEPPVIEQLERLAKLRDTGVITPEEFDAKKADLLARM